MGWLRTKLRKFSHWATGRKLLLKTKDGVVHKGRYIAHFEQMISMRIDPDDVVDTGFILDGKEHWQGNHGSCDCKDFEEEEGE